MAWHAAKTGKRGHPETSSECAIQTCLTLKVLFGLPLRQTVGLVASLIEMAGLDWHQVPRRWRVAGAQAWYAPPQGAPCFATSSRNHGVRRKVHIGMDTQTGDVPAVEFTSSRQGDRPVLPDLLAPLPEEEEIGSVTADGADDTRRCHGAIVERGAEARIPIRRNGRVWKEDCPATGVRNDILQETRRLGRVNWKRSVGYHVRRREEARMNCLKPFSVRIASRAPDRQTAEIQIRIDIMNRYDALGAPEIIAVG